MEFLCLFIENVLFHLSELFTDLNNSLSIDTDRFLRMERILINLCDHLNGEHFDPQLL